MEFKETPFGTEIIGLDKVLNKVGEIGLLQLKNEQLQQRLATVETVCSNRLETILLLHNCYRDACSEAESILSDLRKLEAERDWLKAVLVKISEWGCNGQCYDLVKTLCPCCIAKQALDVTSGKD